MIKYIDEQIDATEIPEAKSLRWLALNFPKIENPKDDIERMQNCIHAYCANGADLINRQEAEIERLKSKCENTQIGYNFAKNDIKELKKDKYKLQKALNQSEDYRVIAKSEAIKEFMEKIDNAAECISRKLSRNFDEFMAAKTFLKALRHKMQLIVKEMVGESNA